MTNIKQVQDKPSQHCYHWVSKALLKAQGFYEGNKYIWIPKNHVQPRRPKLQKQAPKPNKINRCTGIPKARQTCPQPQQVLKPTSSTNRDKGKMLSPPPSPPMNPTTMLINSDSNPMEIGNSSTTSWDHNNDDGMVLIFPPPRTKISIDQEKLQLMESAMEDKVPSPISSTKMTQLSQAAEILKRRIQPPQWWVNRFSKSPTPVASKQGITIAHTSDHPISVFLAEAETQEDLLENFQHWIPYEEEQAELEEEQVEYENIFFQQFWPQLPREIRSRVKVLVYTAHYHQRHPFGAVNAPSAFQRALANVLESLPR